MSATQQRRPRPSREVSAAFRQVMRDVGVHRKAVRAARVAVSAAMPGTTDSLAARRTLAGLLITFHAERSARILQALVATGNEATLRAIMDVIEGPDGCSRPAPGCDNWRDAVLPTQPR